MTTLQAGQSVLVTGGSGFIGRHLVGALRATGARVRVLTRAPEAVERLFAEGDGHDGVEVCEGDLLSAENVAKACADVETVFHVGGLYKFGPRHAREMWRVNVEGTEHVLAAAWRARVGRVVHVSSTGVLSGGSRKPLTERDFPSHRPRWSPYRASKWEAERRALDWAARGLPVVIACPPCPVGPGDEGPTPTGRMVLDFIAGRFPFSARTGLNFIGVSDLIGGLLAVARQGRPGERYLLGQENLWLDEFLALLSELTGRPPPRVQLPWPVIALAGVFGEAAGRLGWHRPGEDRAAECRICLETALKARCVQFFDCDKARWELGWQPRRPLRDSVAEAVAWFQARLPAAAAQSRPARAAAATSPHHHHPQGGCVSAAAAAELAAEAGAEVHGAS